MKVEKVVVTVLEKCLYILWYCLCVFVKKNSQQKLLFVLWKINYRGQILMSRWLLFFFNSNGCAFMESRAHYLILFSTLF